MAAEVAVGVTTAHLDAIAEEFILSEGAIPAFKGYPGVDALPGVHLPVGQRPGGARHPGATPCATATSCRSTRAWCSTGGWPTRARTYAVGPVSPIAARLIEVTRVSLERGIAACRVGNHVGDIGHAVQAEVEAAGFSVVQSLVGHGVGRSMHEEPQVPNFGRPGSGPELIEGLVIAIEPMVNAGAPRGDPGRRRLDHHHQGRVALGPLGAHGRRHGRRAEDPHTGLTER